MSGIIGGAGSKSGVIGTTELEYEEGTWTVTVAGTTASLGNATGFYVKIGDRVFFDYYSSATTFASSSADASFTLPFAAIAATGRYPVFYYDHGNAVDGSSTGGYINQGTNNAYFLDASAITASTYINGSSKYLMVSGNYQIA
jgi:hypothetical protein